jgi:NhaP-type Na+/H+ and K+/H+ antiporter
MRELILSTTFAVVIFSVVVQATTFAPLAAHLASESQPVHFPVSPATRFKAEINNATKAITANFFMLCPLVRSLRDAPMAADLKPYGYFRE